MRVILLKDVAKVGKKYDVKDVSDGYARNFLLPRNLAKQASDTALKEFEAKKAELEAMAEEDLKKAEELAARIDGQEIEIKAKASEDGKLYGAITPAKILKALNDNGFEVKKNQIKIGEPIKEIGECELVLELAHGLEAKIKLIVSEEEKEEA